MSHFIAIFFLKDQMHFLVHPVTVFISSILPGCTAYDVVVSPAFYEKMENSAFFQSFFTTVVFEGLENKYDMSLDRNVTVLKKKKCVGTIQPHSIRTKSKPVIMEMSSNAEQNSSGVS